MEKIIAYSNETKIMRQSQSKLALDYLRDCGITPSILELNRVVDIFVECCSKEIEGKLKERVKKLDKWIEENKVKV
tara:strand:+ start:529 stop:756 length:228 start_codon:yes stop_codon:yes gene_type:complete